MDPKYTYINTEAIGWEKSDRAEGVDIKTLGTANGTKMELFRFAPNTSFPIHYHEGPEFVYLLEGRARQNGHWLEQGWASIAETGTLDEDFLSGAQGCILLSVYSSSRYFDEETEDSD